MRLGNGMLVEGGKKKWVVYTCRDALLKFVHCIRIWNTHIEKGAHISHDKTVPVEKFNGMLGIKFRGENHSTEAP